MNTIPGRDGLPTLKLCALDGSTAEIYLHGAHVTSWKPAGLGEQLFVSSTSEYGGSAAIRGGVPVAFPQFSGLGSLKKHGFVRNMAWQVVNFEPGTATLRLTSDESTLAQWPHPFSLDLVVVVEGASLNLTLRVANTGDDAFAFTGALHTYFAVSSANDATVAGLEGLTFVNSPTQTLHPELEPFIAFGAEVDRAYLHAQERKVLINDGSRCLEITQDGFPDTVVWNPAADVGGRIPDLEANGWTKYVCVEAAAVRPAITVPAGSVWVGTQNAVVVSD
jgi:glucose-6-phosphate 1-epimerase